MLYWLTAAASLVGVWLNIRKLRSCFAVWLVCNGIWAVADFAHGLPAQAALQAVYFGLSIYGLYSWRAPQLRRA